MFIERGADISLKEGGLATIHGKNQEQKNKREKSENLFSGWDEHRIPLQELAAKLKTDFQNGLTDEEANERNALQGDNKLSEKEKTPWWMKMIYEVTNPFSMMLWCCSGLSFSAYTLKPEIQSNLYLLEN